MNYFPKISIITPSFNQAAFLERTIESVLAQEYPNLEYIIIDGGSTDGSVEIIHKYASKLAYWQSKPDLGQANAINQGLRRATGEWIGWQNSDDVYLGGVFNSLVSAAVRHPKATLIIGNLMIIDELDNAIHDVRYITPNYKALLAEGMLIANQSSFWKRGLQDQVGLLDERYHCSFDYDWFLRLTKGANGVHVDSFWGALRMHGETKTSLLTNQFQLENDQILAGRNMRSWKKMAYRFRRTVILVMSGHIGYVLRGFWRRFFSVRRVMH